nr:MFS transporter [Cysteiniphilum sp. 19X3-34]
MERKVQNIDKSTSTRNPIYGLIFANAIYAFDFMVIAIAMPEITAELNGRDWYTLGFGIFILTSLLGIVWAGKTVDNKGPHFVLSLGLGSLFVSLIFTALTPNYFAFVIGRGIQGASAGAIITAVNALVNLIYSSQLRPRVIAILNTAWLIPSLIAPVVGGVILETIGWRYIFIFQLPFIIITAYFILPAAKIIPVKTMLLKDQRILRHALQLSIAAIIIMCGFNESSSIFSIVLVSLGFIFIIHPLKHLLPQGMISAKHGLPSALICFSLVTFIFYLTEIFIPLLLTQYYNLSASLSGFALATAAITWPIGGLLQAKLVQKKSYRFCGTLGAIGITFSVLLLILQIMLHWPYQLIYLFWGIAGFWLGQIKAASRAYAMLHTPTGKEGSTSSAQGILDSLTGGFAAGLGGMIYQLSTAHNIAIDGTISYVWCLSAIAALLMIFVTYFRFEGLLRIKPRYV